MIHTIDLKFLNFKNAIAAFLIETSAGPVLIETGPHSTIEHLKEGIHQCGYRVEDIHHVLVSHIHLDHAGAAWYFAEKGATVYVHPKGAPHLEMPRRLMSSAKRIYGDDMDRLWGQMHPIEASRLSPAEDKKPLTIGDKEFIPLFTPGHAIHHIAWKLNDVLFTGDVGGVKIQQGPVMPPCPPPDIDIEAWLQSIEKIRQISPSKLYLTHFGAIQEISSHLDQLQECLQSWSLWIREYWEQGMDAESMRDPFQKYVAGSLRKSGMSNHEIQIYEAANPSWMSVYGLMRYWEKSKHH